MPARYNAVMDRSALARAQTEQAALRLRLAATALATTLLLLAPGADRVAAAAVLLGYAAGALLQRFATPRGVGPLPAALGVAGDLLFATAVTALVPGSGWALYAFAIGTAALRYGPVGIAAATAAAVVGYDVVLLGRAGEARASDLWPVQVLLAFGVLAVELVWVAIRAARERHELRAFSLAQRDLASAVDEAGLLGRLVDHAVRGFRASGAAVERRMEDGRMVTLQVRGLTVPREPAPASLEVPVAADTVLRATFAPTDVPPEAAAALRDLAADVAPLLGAARERAREREERLGEQHLLRTLRRLESETSAPGVLAQAIELAQELAGPAAIVRPADGTRILGDLDAVLATPIAREAAGPRLFGVGALADPAVTAIAVPVGPGQTLVALGERRPLTQADLGLLRTLGEAVAAAADRLVERDTLIATAADLRRRTDELDAQLRERDDAVALAVHELRNPLTSVQAYGQLMSRNLAAVQRQVTQLDSLIEDLLHMPGGSPPRALVRTPVDLYREVADAAARLRVAVPAAVIQVEADTREGPATAAVDVGRFAQVIDNVLRNAVKFSPPGAPVEVDVRRRGAEVWIRVRDRGDGIVPGEEERIFERHVRGSQHAQGVAGAGLGLAVSREIVTQHGGRISAESPGPGRGSVFAIVLPAAASPVGARSPDRQDAPAH